MKKTEKTTPTQAEKDHAADKYPGAAIDRADDGKVSQKTIDERTRTLNNNPRNQQ